MRLLNYTPHSVCVRTDDDDNEPDVVFLSDGELRCTGSSQTHLAEWSVVCGVSVRTPPKYVGLDYTPPKRPADDGERSGTPSPNFTFEDDGETGIIVSMVVGEHLRSNPDIWSGPVFTPDSGPGSAIRDEGGRIVAVRRLCLYKGIIPPRDEESRDARRMKRKKKKT